MSLINDVKWTEQYTSVALNRKLAGVLPPGVYWGYEVAPAGGMLVRIWSGDDPDYPESIAVVDRNGYSVTVRQSGEDTVSLAGRAGSTVSVVLDALYLPNQDTVSSLQAVTAPADHHVVLARVTIPAGATEITAGMVDFAPRTLGNPAVLAMSYASSLMTVVATNITLKAQIGNVTAWAATQGYDANTLY